VDSPAIFWDFRWGMGHSMGRKKTAGGWGTSGAEGLRCWTLSDDFRILQVFDLGIYNLFAIENGL